MGTSVFPTLQGLAWNVVLKPRWRTTIQEAVSGREIRLQNWVYPLYDITLTYEFLRATVANSELQTLLTFFNARGGQFDQFYLDIGALLNDPAWDTVASGSPQLIGTGDGASVYFQLIANYGGWLSPIASLAPTIYFNGVAQSPSLYTISTNGLLTFATAPGAGVAITWSGTYYFLARFAKDTYELNAFMNQLFEAKTIELLGVRA
jgi:uncharacterized protein (TIGR02217 family)